MAINWNEMKISKADNEKLFAIATRAAKMAKKFNLLHFDALHCVMDLTLAHHTQPLALAELLDAEEVDFTHDVWGISRHLDRETGALRDHFIPRYDLRNHTEAA
jgi:hypothetical protein